MAASNIEAGQATSNEERATIDSRLVGTWQLTNGIAGIPTDARFTISFGEANVGTVQSNVKPEELLPDLNPLKVNAANFGLFRQAKISYSTFLPKISPEEMTRMAQDQEKVQMLIRSNYFVKYDFSEAGLLRVWFVSNEAYRKRMEETMKGKTREPGIVTEEDVGDGAAFHMHMLKSVLTKDYVGPAVFKKVG